MKTTSILISLLTTFAAASPTLRRQAAPIPSVTFALSNDIDGPSVSITVPANGNPVHFSEAFAGTALDQSGTIVATSGQVTAIDQVTECVIDGAANGPFALNAQHTFVDFDGTDVAVETDVSGLTITCEF